MTVTMYMIHSLRFFIVCILVAAIFLSCGYYPGKNRDEYGKMISIMDELTGPIWVLAAPPILDEYDEVTELTLVFDDNERISGETSCNEYFADIEAITADQIRFGQIVSTKRGCKSPEIEKAYLNALRNVETFEITEDELVLFWNDGNAAGDLHYFSRSK